MKTKLIICFSIALFVISCSERNDNQEIDTNSVVTYPIDPVAAKKLPMPIRSLTNLPQMNSDSARLIVENVYGYKSDNTSHEGKEYEYSFIRQNNFLEKVTNGIMNIERFEVYAYGKYTTGCQYQISSPALTDYFPYDSIISYIKNNIGSRFTLNSGHELSKVKLSMPDKSGKNIDVEGYNLSIAALSGYHPNIATIAWLPEVPDDNFNAELRISISIQSYCSNFHISVEDANDMY